MRHTCDNRSCVNPAHLVLGTQSQNLVDAGQRVRLTQARLTPEEVLMIKRSDKSSYQLHKELGCSYTAVKDVRSGKWWSWLNSEDDVVPPEMRGKSA